MRRPTIAAALLILAAAAVSAQDPVQHGRAVFRSTVQLVPLSVTVLDREQQFVKGLTADDFSVYEDGVQQELRFFEAADVPIDLIVLVDTSSSMAHKMPLVHEAAVGFLRTLREGDRGAVVAFADRVSILQGLTSDRHALEAAVRRTTPRGATALRDGIYISLRQFGQAAQQAGEVRRQAMVVLTDGDDTSSLLGFDEVVTTARRSGVSIYPITIEADAASQRVVSAGLRRTASQAHSDFSLRQLAQETGAQPFFSIQIASLKDVYATIAEELSSQYAIAYAPSDPRPDERFRRITVRVASRPELRLRTRTGYVMTGGHRAGLVLPSAEGFAPR